LLYCFHARSFHKFRKLNPVPEVSSAQIVQSSCSMVQ
jgi:hypothetical protein